MRSEVELARSDKEDYALYLESVVFRLHELFWYEIDSRGNLVPSAYVVDDRRLLGIVHEGIEQINKRTGRNTDFRVKAKLDRRLIYGVSAFLVLILLADIIVNDILSCYKDAILSFFN